MKRIRRTSAKTPTAKATLGDLAFLDDLAPEECAKCSGVPNKKCGVCDGEGEHECTCDCGHVHTHECGECGGTGGHPCVFCQGMGDLAVVRAVALRRAWGALPEAGRRAAFALNARCWAGWPRMDMAPDGRSVTLELHGEFRRAHEAVLRAAGFVQHTPKHVGGGEVRVLWQFGFGVPDLSDAERDHLWAYLEERAERAESEAA